MPRLPQSAAKKTNRHLWLVDPLADDPTFLLKPMFGARSGYLEGRLVIVLCDREDPWRGVLLPTEREHQPSLRADFPALAPHPVLPKWLYLPEDSLHFESDAQALVELARRRDPRVGIVPPPRKPRGRRTPKTRP